MDKQKQKRKQQGTTSFVAPGIDPNDAYGEEATKSEIEKGEATRTTRLTSIDYEVDED